MAHRPSGLAGASAVLALGLILAACGGGAPTQPGQTPGGGTPQRGGTLKFVGGDDVDELDPASSYYVTASMMMRGYTRQLFSYRSSNNIDQAIVLAPDVATTMPTKGNGGISADGLTYTIKLRDGVMWNTKPARELTAGDFVHGIKRVCNPSKPSGALHYYTSTIKGMAQFCDGFAKVAPTSGAIARYIQQTNVPGMQAKDSKTLVFQLVQPANDFPQILGMTQASAAPNEYYAYVPASNAFNQHILSPGPYTVSSYTAGKALTLARNPAWRKASDPLRNQYVDKVQVTMGVTEADVVQQQLEAGTADLSWDQPVPTARLAQMMSTSDPLLATFPSFNTNPYLVFNIVSPNENRAMSKLQVRQAINYAIDKTQTVRVYGGPKLNSVLDQVIPPGNIGHQTFNLYPTKGNKGDPAKCKSLLAEAGYPNGMSLKAWYRNAGNHPAIAQSYQADLKACGITVTLTPLPGGDYYSEFLQKPEKAKAGQWDISAPGWIPDWYGNNGRTIVQPLFQTNCQTGTINYGCYSNPAVDRLVGEALAAPDASAAAAKWHQADRLIMQDAAIVPFKTEINPIYRAQRVQNPLYMPRERYYDLTNLWLGQ